MSRTPIPLVVVDVATFAHAIERQIQVVSQRQVAPADAHRPAVAEPAAPKRLGHVEILNILARTGGFRNYQHLRASVLAERKLAEPPPAAPPEPPVDHDRVAKALRYFDETGRLIRWPPKANLRDLCLWVLWSLLPARDVLTDRQISDRLKDLHRFGDHALLRRELVDGGHFTRTMDGREYRRVERRPPPDARALIGHVGTR